MANASQLFLLADHVKLSLLERQRAISLNLEPNSQDAEISRSLNTLNEGIQELETSESAPTQDIQRLQQQYNDLYSQYTGEKPPSATTKQPNNPSLSPDFAKAQQRPPSSQAASHGTPSSKFVRFRDSPSDHRQDAQEVANRAALFPYRDDPDGGNDDDDAAPDHSQLSNTQIHTYHSQVMEQQDEQLDRLGQSIGRQRELSIQIGDEVDSQGVLLDDIHGHVDRHQSQIDRARTRIGDITRKAKDNMQLTIIAILIIILVLLIIVLR